MHFSRTNFPAASTTSPLNMVRPNVATTPRSPGSQATMLLSVQPFNFAQQSIREVRDRSTDRVDIRTTRGINCSFPVALCPRRGTRGIFSARAELRAYDDVDTPAVSACGNRRQGIELSTSAAKERRELLTMAEPGSDVSREQLPAAPLQRSESRANLERRRTVHAPRGTPTIRDRRRAAS
jgi:hypothetical protein